MKRKLIISESASKALGALGLPRGILLAVLGHLHIDVAPIYEKINKLRIKEGLRHRKIFVEVDGTQHYFIFDIDDLTSPDHLIVLKVQHTLT